MSGGPSALLGAAAQDPLPGVVVAHALRVADELHVVDRDGELRASLRAASGPATRRRVHSPSAATSNIVVSVTVVRGSTNASTPAWLRVHSRRCAPRRDPAP